MNFLERVQTFLKERIAQISELHDAMNTAQKMSLYALAGVIGISFVMLFAWSRGSAKVPLTRQALDESTLAEIKMELDQRQVDYEINENGLILVDPRRRIELRVHILERNLIPKNKVSEFTYKELFNGQSWTRGRDEFNLQKNRAQLANIARIISHFEMVEDADVLFDPPPENPFVRPDGGLDASVVLTLKRGAELTEQNVAAIANVVAGGLKAGLKAENVKISDSKGRMYRVPEDGTYGSNDRLSLKQKIEAIYVAKAREILLAVEPVVHVQVDVELDMDKVSMETRDVDTENTVSKDEVIETESETSTEPLVGGAPGTASNIDSMTPGSLAGGGGKGLEISRNLEKINTTKDYDVTVSTIQKVPGAIKDLSISVVVPVDALEDGAAPSAEEVAKRNQKIQDYRDLVMGALRISEPSKVTIKILEKVSAPVVIAQAENWVETVMGILSVYGNRIILGVLVLLGLLVIRSALRKAELPELVEVAEVGELAAIAAAEAEAEFVDLDQMSEGEARAREVERRVLEIIGEDPEHAANFIRHWILHEATE